MDNVDTQPVDILAIPLPPFKGLAGPQDEPLRINMEDSQVPFEMQSPPQDGEASAKQAVWEKVAEREAAKSPRRVPCKHDVLACMPFYRNCIGY